MFTRVIKMKRPQYRQGDVLLVPVDFLPTDSVQETTADMRVVLAFGEVTGHAHAIEAKFAKTYHNGEHRFLEVSEGAVLRHEEHSPHALMPGTYRIVIQREYEPAGFRRVID
jgi:hypothetical protein